MPTLARITIYPFKSLDGQEVEQSPLLSTGALANDRRYALVDREEKYVNAKRSDKVHPLRSAVDPIHERLEIVREHEMATFNLVEDREEVEQYFSLLLHERVRVIEDRERGLPDDPDAPGPTVISTATLETVATWFPGLDVDEVRRRFRANLEIGGVEPFWEDRLVGKEGTAIPFLVGGVKFLGVNPCQRCVVPSRDSRTGEIWPGFSKEFGKRREAALPDWAEKSRFNHYYRLAVNTKLGDIGSGTIKVGDEMKLPG